MEGYILSVGYPVGVNATNQSYILELNSTFVELSASEMLLWTKLKSVSRKSLNNKENFVFEKLIKGKICFWGNTLDELYNNIKELKLVRQGYFGINEKKFCISIGKEVFFPTLEQSIIWKFADGENSISDVREFMGNEIKIDEFMRQLIGLMSADLIVGR